MKFLVTGVAGFIGMHISKALLERGQQVVGVDNLNDYYDPQLKMARLQQLQLFSDFSFFKVDISDRDAIKEVFIREKPNQVVHLAAQAGVRYSIENPHAYVDSNLVGFVNVLEGCRHNHVEHLLYASSSSVYGLNTKVPFSTNDNVDHPISLYAATKKANELMAHTYSHLFNIPTTGLRFFTVYGPWGRPDMAYYKFTKAILNGEAIDVYNHGKMQRDFTYIDDIVQGLLHIIDQGRGTANEVPGPTRPLYKIYNIGNNQPVTLRRFITAIEDACEKKAFENNLAMQPGDVPITYADIDNLTRDFGFKPNTVLEQGISNFVGWYKDYYGQ
jgi:UDP-glucuronate 4-epimerase